jgi:predicted Rossmann-fold nucleotide-binding protein
MEAACRGAAEAGGRSLGILVGSGEPNRWDSEVVREADLGLRLRRLSDESAAAIFLPRGLGTMLEIAWMAESVAKGYFAPRPLVFLGLFWRRAVALAIAEAGGPGAELLVRSTRFVSTAEEAVASAFEPLGGTGNRRSPDEITRANS